MSYIGKQPEFTQYPSKFFNGDGTAMTVTLDYAPPNDAALLVFIDGVRQDTSAYGCTGTSLTFTGSVPSGTNNVQVVHMGLTQDVGVPGDDTVTTAKIQDDAVTADKLANSINTEIAANTAKVTNATHTGDVTGATALTIAAGAVDIAMLSATGTASASTVLYGDNSWKAEPVTDTSSIEDDIALLGFKVASNGSMAKYNLSDQVIDDFQDSSGIDLSASTNEFLEGTYVVGSSAHDGTGGIVTYDSGNTIHQFNSDGVFTNATGTTALEYLVVAGGGSGGSGYGGGGGAGGYRTASGFAVVAEQSYPVTVGAGGVAGPYSGVGTSGEDSVFSTITSTGGGRGGAPGDKTGASGGSGGGGNDAAGGGAGNTPSTSPSQGNGGGYGPGNYGGGGGGSSAAGQNASPGAGGAGTANSITGTSVTYAGGGGGGSASSSVPGGAGGSGGGGPGGKGNWPADTEPGPSGSLGVAGTANTGSGGGGGGYAKGGDGGSGVVILKYTTVSKVVADLTLVSTTATATDAITKGDLVLTYTNASGTATLNTDLKGYVSRDNGANYTEGTLVNQGTSGGHIIASFHDLSLGGTDTSQVRYKITTHNQSGGTKETRIQAVSVGWS